MARIADFRALEFFRQRIGNRIGFLRRHEDAADRRAFLSGFHRHLAHRFAQEGIEGDAAGRGLRRKQRRIDAVGLDVHRHAPCHHVGMAAHARAGVGRAGKGDEIVTGERSEELAGAAAQEAQRTIGQHLGGDDVLHHRMRQQRGCGGGLGENRDARDERYRRLLPQPPTREIEGVDVDGDAAARRHQVDGLIVLSLGEPHRLFVEQHARIAQPATESGVIFQRADAAVDVDRRVRLGVAGIGDGDLLIARAIGNQHVGHGADEVAALGVAQVSQAALPLLAREFERSFEIDAIRRNRR